MIRTRLPSLGRCEPVRRIIPTPATKYLRCSGFRSFRVAHVGTGKTFRVPIRHPFGHVAGEIVHAERALILVMFADLSHAVFVDFVLVGPAKSRLVHPRRVIPPRILATIAATRRPFPFRLGRQPLIGPPAVTVRIMPIDADHREITDLRIIIAGPFFGRSTLPVAFINFA